MTNIIVAFSKVEDAKNIKNILIKNGFPVNSVCTSASQALSAADGLGSGIIVSGCRFSDMIYEELHECLSPNFTMLLLASPSQWAGRAPDDLVCLGLPLKVHDLVHTLEMMVQAQIRLKKKRRIHSKERSKEEQELIEQAKAMLRDRNHMEEAEAHRYIQKYSMDSGMNMVEAAQMIMSLNGM